MNELIFACLGFIAGATICWAYYQLKPETKIERHERLVIDSESWLLHNIAYCLEEGGRRVDILKHIYSEIEKTHLSTSLKLDFTYEAYKILMNK